MQKPLSRDINRHYICCHHCDEISIINKQHKNGRYKCPNCGHTIFKYYEGMYEKLYALNLAAMFLFIVTNYFPFLSFSVLGNTTKANFTTSIYYLYLDRDILVALTVLMTTIIIPFMRISIFIILFGSLYHNIVPKYAKQMLKLLEILLPWGMLDVFLIGVLVSIVKLVKMGTIIPGVSLWAFVVMIMIMTYAQTIFDPHHVWEDIEKADKKTRLER